MMTKFASSNKDHYTLGMMILLLLLFVTFCYAQNLEQRFDASFIRTAQSAGIRMSDLAGDEPISRYELTRLMNLTECYDCINPGPRMRRVYTPEFWSIFQTFPSKDFDDIIYEQALHRGKSYYYCVAYVGDMNYMRGYPRATSPICPGGFCGEKNVTKAEFIQVVINIAKRYIYPNYRANRSAINTWMQNLEPNSYADRNLDAEMKKIITDRARACPTGSCQLQSHKELETYMAYCMFNLAACNFSRFGWIGQGYWPVSELNIMRRERFLPLEDQPHLTIHDPITKTYAITILGELHKRIGCVLDTDYDCDSILNHLDNCPNDYNPSQYDWSGDGVGDVCSTDINGNGIPNAPNLVDDNGTVNIHALEQSQDKKIFVHVQRSGLDISRPQAIQIQGLNKFFSQTLLPGLITWDMSDGRTNQGEHIATDFVLPGTYIITSEQGSAIARKSISIPQGTKNLGLMINPLSLPQSGFPRTLSFSVKGEEQTNINRKWNNQTGTTNPQGTISLSLLSGGTSIITLIGSLGNKETSIATMSWDAGFFAERASRLQTDQLTIATHTTGIINLMKQGWSFDDITSIERAINGEKQTQTGLTLHVSQAKPGLVYISTQISFHDGGQHTAILTMTVKNPFANEKKVIGITVDNLKKGINDEFIFVPEVTGFGSREISGLEVDFGDGTIRQFPATIQKFNHRYTRPGQYTVTLKPHGIGCINMIGQLTLAVDHAIDCERHRAEGTLGKFRCDMDKDGIPDVCDDDISGDGRKNLLGLLMFENDDCSIGSNNIITIIQSHEQKIGNKQSTQRRSHQSGPHNKQDTNNGNDNTTYDSKTQKKTRIATEGNIISAIQDVPGYQLTRGKHAKNNINANILARHANVCGLSACPFIPLDQVIDLDRDGFDDRCEPFLRPGANPMTNQDLNKKKQSPNQGPSDQPNPFDSPLSTTGGQNNTQHGSGGQQHDPTLGPKPNPAPNTTTMRDSHADDDGDGIINRIDPCPDEAWDENVTSEGCKTPDADGDSIADNHDDCPTIPGSSRNAGCPLLITNDPCFAFPDMPKGFIASINCTMCPCPFADVGGELAPNDLVRAVLMNPGGTKVYDISSIRPITPDMIRSTNDDDS